MIGPMADPTPHPRKAIAARESQKSRRSKSTTKKWAPKITNIPRQRKNSQPQRPALPTLVVIQLKLRASRMEAKTPALTPEISQR